MLRQNILDPSLNQRKCVVETFEKTKNYTVQNILHNQRKSSKETGENYSKTVAVAEIHRHLRAVLFGCVC